MQKSLLMDEKMRKVKSKIMINVLDLFCGCGGLSYGFESAGYNIVLGIDNDKKALETFELNHKGAKSICGDITVLHKQDIDKVTGNITIDVIIGGPPCQGMSLSGPRRFDDPRNKLYLSYIRLVEEIKPKAFVIENVPGLVSLFGGQIKDSIIKRLTDLGYTVRYQIICAADYGVPQTRRRVVFVGLKNGEFEFPPTQKDKVTCSMALSDLPPLIDSLGEETQSYATECTCQYQELMRQHSSVVKNHIAAVHTVGAHLAKVSLNSTDPVLLDNGRFRRFTPREVARIQSFPESFVLIGSEGAQYRALGNAIAPVMFWYIAKEVAKLLLS